MELCHVEEKGAIQIKKQKAKSKPGASRAKGKGKAETKEESLAPDIESEDEAMEEDRRPGQQLLIAGEQHSSETPPVHPTSMASLPTRPIRTMKIKAPFVPKKKRAPALKHAVWNSEGEEITEEWYAAHQAKPVDVKIDPLSSSLQKRARSGSLTNGEASSNSTSAKRGRKSL